MKKLAIIGTFLILLIPTVFASAGNGDPAPAKITLKDCLTLAFENNPALQAATKEVSVAQAKVKEAEGNFRPKLDYAVFANKAENPVYPYPKAIFPNADTDLSGGSVSLTQALYQGGKLTNQLEIAKTQLNIKREEEKQCQQQLVFKVKEAFYQVWLAEKTLEVVQTSYDNLEHHFQKVNEYYKAGKASKFETLRARVQWDTLKPQVISAQNNLKFAKLSLASLGGFSQGKYDSISTNAAELQIPDKLQLELAPTLDTAYQNRPEMHQSRLSQAISRVQLKLAEAGNKPNLALIGKYQGQALSYSPNDWGDNRYWTCTLNLTGNIYDGSVTAAKVEGARGNIELAAVKEAKLRDQIRLEVEQAIQNSEESLETIRANQANIDLAKETLELTQVRFEAGLATTMDIMDAQLAVDQARNGYYRGVTSYIIAKARLDLVTGQEK